ncbi:heavy-metal-associated domain-containing protein [Desulfospira joergensenii]|uniref:heavy-metal-associated domain-containing protein n=1 Tax=Desulfospira joergensenii TaxID=53329 RepID=UPI0003B711E1|nr:heavy metal-associated domain-containing protein [Desulfospira joergensenii]
MEVTLSIEGMTCHHCSGRVQKFLESRPEISKVVVDLEGKKAEFNCKEGSEIKDIVQGINELGYKTVQK